jgi:polysaccharide export outer membrane protein
MARIPRILLVAAVAACLGGPAFVAAQTNGIQINGVQTNAAPTTVVRNNTDLPTPDAGDAMHGLSAYRIGPMDKLDVTVFQVKDLTGTVDVDASGKIALPLIGSVQAAGLTTAEVSKEIDDRLRQGYVKDPVVTVTVKDTISQKVTVAGAVQKPGVYPITGYTTLSTAVALAQGTDPTRANERKVLLIRNVGGKRMQAAYNLLDIQRGKVRDPQVYGNDTIVVENSTGRGLLRDIATATPLFYLFTVW